VEAAFFMVGAFPPPASGADVFTLFYETGAWGVLLSIFSLSRMSIREYYSTIKQDIVCLLKNSSMTGGIYIYMNSKLFLILLLLCLLGLGCAKPYSQFYKDETNGFDVTTSPGIELPEGEPKVMYSNFDNVKSDEITMAENGYLRLGNSSFNAKHLGEYGAIAQAKKVHASVVILYSKYTDTASGSVPITTPDTQTSTSNYSGNVYGSGGGYGSYSGTGTTTTYGSKTTYFPYNVRRFDQAATYWIRVKINKVKFGIVPIDLTPEARQESGSNRGMLILAVIKGTPAFQADIINGDILRKVGEIEINSRDSYEEAVEKYAGTETQVVVWRKGNEIKKDIKLKP
jgi:PDZ domain